MDLAACSHCTWPTAADGNFCSHCGVFRGPPDAEPVRPPDSAGESEYTEADQAAGWRPTSSSGRVDTSPEARRAVLADLDAAAGRSLAWLTERGLAGSGDDDWLSRITDAETLVGQCETDLDAASAAMRSARYQIDEGHLAERALDPAERHEYVLLLAAQDRWVEATRAYQQARSKLNHLLATHDAVSRPDLGLSPRGGDGGDDGSLSWAQRAHDRARSERLR